MEQRWERVLGTKATQKMRVESGYLYCMGTLYENQNVIFVPDIKGDEIPKQSEDVDGGSIETLRLACGSCHKEMVRDQDVKTWFGCDKCMHSVSVLSPSSEGGKT